MGELTFDVESASQQRQVFLVREVTTRHPSTNGGKQAVREQPDEEFQQVMPLGVQGSQLAFGYPEVPRHGEHADERRAYLAVLAVDLGQDFDRPARNGQDADDLSGLEAVVSAGQDCGFGQTKPPGRALREGVEPFGLVLRQATLTDRQTPPLPASERSPWWTRSVSSSAAVPSTRTVSAWD